MWNALKDLDREDVLGWVGLQSRRTALDALLPSLGIFGVGLLVGAGVGLLLAPKSGQELREDLRDRLQGASEEAQGALSSVTSERTPRAV
jgi:hypothetical protein